MRLYALAAVIGLIGVGMLASAAVIAQRSATSVASAAAPPVSTVASGDSGGEVWGANYFPNIPLVTHRGEHVRFFDDLIQGKIVAISFMYTHCPNVCPVGTARLREVAELLGDRLGKDIFFYSITIDPEHDTPAVLAEFAERWKLPPGWTLLTGAAGDIAQLRKKLGMRLDDLESGDLNDHSIDLLIGNQRTGQWIKRAPFENAHFIASQLGSWLDGFRLASEKNLDYANAPALRRISDGEYLFRNRCASCHGIGASAASERIGPDLLDVTRRRERAWLERWLAEPDVMLEEKDPIAVALHEQYGQLTMPNMRLSEKDVGDLVGYLERESERVRSLRGARAEQ
jgi:protein SCO1/2